MAKKYLSKTSTAGGWVMVMVAGAGAGVGDGVGWVFEILFFVTGEMKPIEIIYSYSHHMTIFLPTFAI